ncbi:unnamed protein product [Rotaria sp. Silwood2]|nr:unnamed protein product [Rotaria sp. Silwood2]
MNFYKLITYIYLFCCNDIYIFYILKILRDEFEAIKNNVGQLQIDYNQMRPTCMELEQQLETAKRINEQMEDELIFYKNQQAAMHDHENEQFYKKVHENIEEKKPADPSIFFDDDIVIVPSIKHSPDSYKDAFDNSNYSPMYYSFDESLHWERKNATHGLNNGGKNLLTSLVRKFANGMTNSTNDRFNRTSTSCLLASIPTRISTCWDCTELEVYALQFQPSGSILATGCSDKMIHLWEISLTGQQRKYCSLQGSHGAINALDFDNEGFRLLAGCSGNKAYIWSYGEQRMLKDIYTGHERLINTCKFISGAKLVTGSADRTIKIWDLHKTLFIGSICHDLVVTDATGTIISGHFDKKIRIWDPFTNRCRTELEYDAAITSLSYNDEKQRLLACFKNDTLKLIDLRRNKTVYTFKHDNFKVSTDTNKAVLSPDGRYACVGSHDGSLVANLILGCSEDFACRVWGLADQRLRHTLTGHGAKVFCAKFVTATLIASGSQDQTLKLWDLQNRQCVRTLFARSECHDLVTHDASGSLISGHFDKKIRFWDARNDSIKCELQLQAAVTSLSINREKQLLLACSRDDTLKLIELRENRVIQTFSHDDFKVASDTIKAVLSPDCTYACAGSNDGSVFVWNTATGKIEKVLNKEHS